MIEWMLFVAKTSEIEECLCLKKYREYKKYKKVIEMGSCKSVPKKSTGSGRSNEKIKKSEE